jgi:hypothetical protein
MPPPGWQPGDKWPGAPWKGELPRDRPWDKPAPMKPGDIPKDWKLPPGGMPRGKPLPGTPSGPYLPPPGGEGPPVPKPYSPPPGGEIPYVLQNWKQGSVPKVA